MNEKLTSKLISKLLEENPISTANESANSKNLKVIEKELSKYTEVKAVLGIDIYRYSQYASIPQMLIPFLFKEIYHDTVNNCVQLEPYIFDGIKQNNLSDSFIDTGDGGFQIFQNPFQAIIFALYFQANVSRYNSIFKDSENVFEIIDEITLRYSLTYDNIYSFEKNFYGPAIINCARIMSKDKLNRLLIDEHTKKWFTKTFNGLENIQFLEILKDRKSIALFNKTIEDKDLKSVLFNDNTCRIQNVDLMKIGEIKSKLDILSIYNVHIQSLMHSPNSKFKKYSITLGNLNSSGLTE